MENKTNTTPSSDSQPITPGSGIPSSQTSPSMSTSSSPANPSSPTEPTSPASPLEKSDKPADKPTSTPPSTTPPTTPPSPEEQKPAGGRKGLPFPLMILLLIISFFIGLIIATLYFQNQLKELSPQTNAKEATEAAKEVKLVIGTDATYEPMEFLNDQGTLMGYDIDLGQQLATELGAKVEYKNIPWDSLFTSLEKKEIDMVISSVTITDERKQKYDFSEPYVYAGQVFITNKDVPATGSASLQGKKIGVQEGTTSEQEALKYTVDAQVVRFPDNLQATNALKEKKIDAVISDLTSAKGIVKTNTSLQILGEPLTNEAYGIVFRKGDARRKDVDTALESLRVKGIITDLKQKWLD